jgi:hypothetical protein
MATLTNLESKLRRGRPLVDRGQEALDGSFKLAADEDPYAEADGPRPVLVGWGASNVVEGLIDHRLLGRHHVRDDRRAARLGPRPPRGGRRRSRRLRAAEQAV